MIVSHKYQFIFIKTRKTAGTSIEISLSPLCGEEDVFTPISQGDRYENHRPRNYEGWFNPLPEIISGDREPRKSLSECYHRIKYLTHSTALVARHRMSRRVWNNYFKFCVDRNPFDKVVSMYEMNTAGARMRGKERRTLESWLERGKNMPFNYPFYMDKEGNQLVDKVLKYENLNDELMETLRGLGVPFEGLNVRAKGHYRKKRNYKDYYDDHTKAMVEKIFRYELDLYNYKF